MCLDADGQPDYIGGRKAVFAAWFFESIHSMTTASTTETTMYDLQCSC
jgi:hypothetical protein